MLTQTKTVICDLDGTVANLSHRLHFIKADPPRWDKFFEACIDDEPFKDIIDLLWTLYPTTSIKYFSGRSDVVRKQTEDWLAKHELPLGELRMRKAGDHRPDYQVKEEMVGNLKPEDVWFILDDRDQVVNMWRSKGFRVLQVANGDF